MEELTTVELIRKNLDEPYKSMSDNELIKSLDKISDTSLIKIFKNAYPDSMTKFSKIYNINQRNFSGWLNGKRTSIQSENAMRNWIKQELEIPIEERSIQERSEGYSERMKQKILDENWNPSTGPEIYRKFLGKIDKRLRRIIFIDADNIPHIMDKLNTTIDQIESLKYEIHIIFVVKKFVSRGYAIYTKYTDEPWFSLMTSESNRPDSADRAIAMLSASLNTILSKNVDMAIVSNDKFSIDLTEKLRGMVELLLLLLKIKVVLVFYMEVMKNWKKII